MPTGVYMYTSATVSVVYLRWRERRLVLLETGEGHGDGLQLLPAGRAGATSAARGLHRRLQTGHRKPAIERRSLTIRVWVSRLPSSE